MILNHGTNLVIRFLYSSRSIFYSSCPVSTVRQLRMVHILFHMFVGSCAAVPVITYWSGLFRSTTTVTVSGCVLFSDQNFSSTGAQCNKRGPRQKLPPAWKSNSSENICQNFVLSRFSRHVPHFSSFRRPTTGFPLKVFSRLSSLAAIGLREYYSRTSKVFSCSFESLSEYLSACAFQTELAQKIEPLE